MIRSRTRKGGSISCAKAFEMLWGPIIQHRARPELIWTSNNRARRNLVLVQQKFKSVQKDLFKKTTNNQAHRNRALHKLVRKPMRKEYTKKTANVPARQIPGQNELNLNHPKTKRKVNRNKRTFSFTQLYRIADPNKQSQLCNSYITIFTNFKHFFNPPHPTAPPQPTPPPPPPPPVETPTGKTSTQNNNALA